MLRTTTRATALLCSHCGTRNVIGRCATCRRPFVVTLANLGGWLRTDDDPSVADLLDTTGLLCDLHLAQAWGFSAIVRAGAALRQRRCTSCRTEFLVQHGL